MAFPAVTTKEESDVVVTAMIMGMACEILAANKPLSIIAKTAEAAKLQTPALESLNAVYASMGIKQKLKAVASEDWNSKRYITGKEGGKDLTGKARREQINWDDLTFQAIAQVGGKLKDMVKNPKGGGEENEAEGRKAALESGLVPRGALYLGPGAYTGMLFVDGLPKYVGSTFELHALPGVKATPIQGIPDTMDRQGGGNVGYCHGMIQAAYAAGATAPKGITIEVASGTKTTKLASCFGCTTFMTANNRMPDGIHLGEGASWSPIDPGNAWAIAKMNERFMDVVDDKGHPIDRTKALQGAITTMNKKWEDKCSDWLLTATNITAAEYINPDHLETWKSLVKFVGGKKQAWAGAAFLNALGFVCNDPKPGNHGDDFNRVARTLKAKK